MTQPAGARQPSADPAKVRCVTSTHSFANWVRAAREHPCGVLLAVQIAGLTINRAHEEQREKP